MDPMTGSPEHDLRSALTYATHDGVALQGDLYLPKGAGPFPALVAVHGGGWQQGARSAFQYWGPYLAARGYGFFSVSSPVGQEGTEDVSAGGARRRGGRAIPARQRGRAPDRCRSSRPVRRLRGRPPGGAGRARRQRGRIHRRLSGRPATQGERQGEGAGRRLRGL